MLSGSVPIDHRYRLQRERGVTRRWGSRPDTGPPAG